MWRHFSRLQLGPPLTDPNNLVKRSWKKNYHGEPTWCYLFWLLLPRMIGYVPPNLAKIVPTNCMPPLSAKIYNLNGPPTFLSFPQLALPPSKTTPAAAAGHCLARTTEQQNPIPGSHFVLSPGARSFRFAAAPPHPVVLSDDELRSAAIRCPVARGRSSQPQCGPVGRLRPNKT